MLRYLRSHRPRRLRLLALLVLLACGGTTVAYGYLSATSQPGDTAPAVKARTMPAGKAPSQVTANASEVTVTWSQSDIGSASVGATGGQYLVRRYSTNGVAQAIAEGTCAVPVTGTGATLSCKETAVPAGTWTYTVQTKLSSWVGSESDKIAATATVTVAPADVIPPDSPTISAPTAGAVVGRTPVVSGTASGTGSDRGSIAVQLYKGNCSTACGTVGFELVAQSSSAATLASSGAWTYTAAPVLTTGTFTAKVVQSDVANNSSLPAYRTFAVDATAPTPVAITSPSAGDTNFGSGSVLKGTGGTAAVSAASSVDEGFATVRIWTGAGTAGAPLWSATAAIGRNGAWSVTGPALTKGTQYTARAEQRDGVGNETLSSPVTWVAK